MSTPRQLPAPVSPTQLFPRKQVAVPAPRRVFWIVRSDHRIIRPAGLPLPPRIAPLGLLPAGEAEPAAQLGAPAALAADAELAIVAE